MSAFYDTDSMTPLFKIIKGQNLELTEDSVKVIGNKNKVHGTASTVEGDSNTVTGDRSWITGNNNVVSGDMCCVIGTGNYISGLTTMVRGCFNFISSDGCTVSPGINFYKAGTSYVRHLTSNEMNGIILNGEMYILYNAGPQSKISNLRMSVEVVTEINKEQSVDSKNTEDEKNVILGKRNHEEMSPNSYLAGRAHKLRKILGQFNFSSRLMGSEQKIIKYSHIANINLINGDKDGSITMAVANIDNFPCTDYHLGSKFTASAPPLENRTGTHTTGEQSRVLCTLCGLRNAIIYPNKCPHTAICYICYDSNQEIKCPICYTENDI